MRAIVITRRWSQALPVAIVLAVAAVASPATVAELSSAAAASFADPAKRAEVLGLPRPVPARGPAREVCATDVTGVYPQACFPTADHAAAYIEGTPAAGGGQTIELTGSGGQAALIYGPGLLLGSTCATRGCDTVVQSFYIPAASSTCTHAYIQNDYFSNNTYAFKAARWSRQYTNCGFIGLYRGGTQQGSGALGCHNSNPYDYTTYYCGGEEPTPPTYYSISWSNRT